MRTDETVRGRIVRLLKKATLTVLMMALAVFALLQWSGDTPASVQRDSPDAEQAPQRNTVAVGGAAPNFELMSIVGEPVRLSDFRGRPVAVTFMHSW